MCLSLFCFFRPLPCPALRIQGRDTQPPRMTPAVCRSLSLPCPHPAVWLSATLCGAPLGSGELWLLVPLGCSGLHGSTGLGSSGWFVKDILNGQGKPRQGGEGGPPGMLIGGAHTCSGAPGLPAEESVRGGPAGATAGPTDRGEGLPGVEPGLDLGGTCQCQGRQGRGRRLGGLGASSRYSPRGLFSWVCCTPASVA